MALSDRSILRLMQEGAIIIDPFIRANLSTSSYDVRLGEWFFREQRPRSGSPIYNPWSEEDVLRVWGGMPERAQSAEEWFEKNGPLKNIKPTDRIIWIGPGETILAHTIEFIGGQHGKVTTMMKARSSAGRNFINVCKCAGWGDVGYVNRWTMEISNSSRDHTIPIPVGRRIGQMVFFECAEPILAAEADYSSTGKYQTSKDIEEVKRLWSPLQMLPKMYLDREIREP
jgi:dCTP deaminase